MKRKKHFKIYFHNLHFLKTSSVRFKSKENAWFSIFYFAGLFVIGIFKALYSFCFLFGNSILRTADRFIVEANNEFQKTRHSFSERFKIILRPDFAKTLALFLILSAVTFAGFKSFGLLATALEIKQKIIQSTELGGKQLMEAQEALQMQDFESAQNKFFLAYKSFSESQSQLKTTNELVNKLSEILPQKKDAQRLLKAATSLSEAGNELVIFYRNFSSIELNASGISSRKQPKELFYLIKDSLNSIESRLVSASFEIQKINLKSVPEEYREDFLKLKENLQILEKSSSGLKQLSTLALDLIAGQKQILILFQNNNELRPSGGFIGTFGSLKSNYGKIEEIEVSSVYDLDGQLKENISPPVPILNINDRWFLRDSNWFADFEDSAKKIISFYEKEGRETPDTIIAMTPNLIIDLLKITGPMEMPAYGVTLTDENFVETTQIFSSVLYPTLENKPKQILADLVPLLLQKLNELRTEDWPLVLEALQKNFTSKQVAIYSRDQNVQETLESFNWSGKIEENDRDYLMVISSNLGGTKTDSLIKQKISLKTTIEENGEIINELVISRLNKWPDLPNTENISFLRIYVPEGSQLLENVGFDYLNLDHLKNQEYKTDKDIYALEKASIKDVVTGTVIGIESGKTYFGNWIKLKGGEDKTVRLTYKLPFKLKDIDRYSLLIQKQLGSQDDSLNWEMNFSGRKLDWHNLTNAEIETSSFKTGIFLDKDYLLGGVFSLR